MTIIVQQNKAHPTIIRKNKLMVAPSNSNVTNSKKINNKKKKLRKENK